MLLNFCELCNGYAVYRQYIGLILENGMASFLSDITRRKKDVSGDFFYHCTNRKQNLTR